jgi:hypothetical protein
VYSRHIRHADPNLLLLCVLALGAQAQQGTKFAVLPTDGAQGIVASQGGWKPVKTDIDGAESGIAGIASMKADNWRGVIQIEHPERYFRQYVPIRHAGKNLFYLNAFCEEPPADWLEKLYTVSDGATCYWQALYDPATKKYSHLTINARG